MRTLSGLFALCLVACGGGIKTAESLTEALAAAAAGDVIELGEASITGSFEIPAGVVLRGVEGSVIVAPTGATALTVSSTDEATTTIENLVVQADGAAGIVLRGAFDVQITDVAVDATTGIGIGAEGVTFLTLTRVQVTGPVTAENADDVPSSPDRAEWATHGLVTIAVADAQLDDVSVSGFAEIGVSFLDTVAIWKNGDFSNNLGVGMLVDGESVSLESVEACGTLQGARLPPAYAIAVVQAGIITTDVRVCDGEGIGILHHAATGLHTDLEVLRNENAAVWMQAASDVQLDGVGTRLVENRFAGIVAVDSIGLVVRDTLIESTQLVTRAAGTAGSIEVGDGIQLLRSSDNVVIDKVVLSNNQRTGFLVDNDGGAFGTFAMTAVTITGTGTQLGCLSQNTQPSLGWDAGVDRQGVTAANDAAFTGLLDIVGILGPDRMPIGDSLRAGGVSSLLGP